MFTLFYLRECAKLFNFFQNIIFFHFNQGDAKQTNGIFQTNSRMEEEARKALCRQNQAERELEKAYDKISKLQSELASAQTSQESNCRLSYLIVFLIQCCHDVYDKVMKLNKSLEASALHPVDKLQKLCVLTVFRHRLQRVRELGYDEEIIYDLLDAQANVFQWHKHEMKDIEIARLTTEIAYIAWEKDKLAFYHGLGVQDKVMSQRDEFCLTALVQNIPINIQQNITINTQSVPIGRTKHSSIKVKIFEILVTYTFKLYILLHL